MDSLNKVIGISLWRRPLYTERIINALLRCDGIEDYHVIIGLDHGADPAVVALAKEARFETKEILPPDKKRNCNGNIRRTLTRAFDLSDYVIHIEDDILVAKDTLRYFEWARQFGVRKDVYSASAWRHDKGWLPDQKQPKPSSEESKVGTQCYFTCWGFAYWKDRFNEALKNWPADGQDMTKSWCVHNSEVKGKRVEVLPHISRVQNIGEELGTHRGAALNSFWIEDNGADFDGNYKLG